MTFFVYHEFLEGEGAISTRYATATNDIYNDNFMTKLIMTPSRTLGN